VGNCQLGNNCAAPPVMQRTNYGPQIITKIDNRENMENSPRDCLHWVTKN